MKKHYIYYAIAIVGAYILYKWYKKKNATKKINAQVDQKLADEMGDTTEAMSILARGY